MKKICGILVFVFVSILVLNTNAMAITYIEDFEAPFPAWESGWLGTNSNLHNYYVVIGGSNNNRGNNPDGLWLDDGDSPYVVGDIVNIVFNPSFGDNLTSFAIDIAGYVPAQLQIFDKFNNSLLNTAITLTQGAFTDPGTYAHYAVTSANGISKFSFVGSQSDLIEGNTSIDNVVVNYNDAVIPEPATMSLLGLGLLGLLGLKKRKGKE